MQRSVGHIAELQLFSGEQKALITCPREIVPSPGQYLLAAEKDAIQATPIFPAGTWQHGFQLTGPFPSSWRPGTELTLSGPVGHGFHLPADIQRLALIGLGNTSARLLPLVKELKSPRASITLFSDAHSSHLPPDVEAYPIQDLAEVFGWADFFGIEVPLGRIETLAAVFNQPDMNPAGLRGQVLVQADMPCCGLGKCGVCALKVKRNWRFTCEDGPVFDLAEVIMGLRW